MKYRKGVKAEVKRKLPELDQDFLHRNSVVFLIFAAALMLWMVQPRYGRFGWKSNLVVNEDIQIPAITGLILLIAMPALFYIRTRKILDTKILVWGMSSQVMILLGLFSIYKWPLGFLGLLGIIVSAALTFIEYLYPNKYLFYLNMAAGLIVMLVMQDTGWLKAAVAGMLVQVFLIEPAQKETSQYFNL